MDRVVKIMEKYNVDLEEALEIEEMQDRFMTAFSSWTNPYSKTAH